MKNTLFFTLLLSLVGFSETYSQGFNFGLKGGVNFADFNGSSVNFKSENITSYHAGVFMELGIAKGFSLQPELLYSTTGADISFADAAGDFKNKLGYLSLPLMARIYLIPKWLSIDIGPQLSYLMNEKGNANLESSKDLDFAFTGGVTLHLFGPLFIQGRYIHGLTDVKPDAELTNRVIQISAGLRF